MIEEIIAPNRTLLLDSLEIQNFRAFRHLRIEQLGRVNLITGKNNVGKTSLLEALYLYARGGSPNHLLELLETRDEIVRRRNGDSETRIEDVLFARNIVRLFHNRHSLYRLNSEAIRIGRVSSSLDELNVRIVWLNREEAISSLEKIEAVILSNPEGGSVGLDQNTPVVAIRTRTKKFYLFPVNQLLNLDANPLLYLPYPNLDWPDAFPGLYVSSAALSIEKLSRLWDEITLTPSEEEVLSALRIIAPDVERLSFIDSYRGMERRIPIVKRRSEQEPVPLRSMGEGMYRLFGFVLSLANAKKGMLFVDEIENGMHYTVLPQVWKLIFETARRLNVQVFATTHSWDCIEAFQQAAAEDGNEEAMLIRLQTSKDGIKSVLYDERRLGIATREQIEVR